MTARKSLKTLALVLTFIFLYNCSRDENITPDIQINDFVWGSMNAFYKWQSSVNDLSDRKFSSRNELNSYLAGFGEPKALFSTLINTSTDTLSVITEDYNTLYNIFEGTVNTNGMKISVARYANNSNNVYAYVRYVVPNSDAFTKGIQRGTIFNQVNGQPLNLNNYTTLLNDETYAITTADFNDGNPTSTITSASISLVGSEIKENPIAASSIIQQGGKNIGYIAVNRFIPNYDTFINKIIGNFRTNNVKNLIIDLRYNNSGAIESSAYLASMITGQFKGEQFTSNVWNEKVLQNINPTVRNNYFTDEINNGFTPKETINSLNLQNVYVLTTNLTATVSEVLINSLKPYIDVKVIGTQTSGQFLCSSILYDSDDYSLTGENFNISHKWATYPVVLEAMNKDNQVSAGGITPDLILGENPGELGILGETSDPIIRKTVEYIITGNKPSQLNGKAPQILWNSEIKNADYKRMHTNYKPNPISQ